jgi:quercetin dioxygenase-like cupin family protein
VTLLALIFVAFFDTTADESIGRRVQELLRAHQADIFGCVEKGGTAPEHEVLVRVIAGEKGMVQLAEVLKSSRPSPSPDGARNGESGTPVGETIGKCITSRIRAWDLTPLGLHPGDQVVMPLAFKPDSARATVEVIEVPVISKVDCGKAPEQAFYVLDGPVEINGTILMKGDAMWMPPSAACTLRGAGVVMRVQSGQKQPGSHVVRIQSQLPPAPSAKQAFTVRAGEPRELPIAGGKGTVKLYLDGRGAAFALDVMVADAGVKVPPHVHDKSDELIHVVSGKGTTMIGGKPAAAATFRIPAGVEHSLSVDEKMTAVQVYAPAGPEQRFKGATK